MDRIYWWTGLSAIGYNPDAGIFPPGTPTGTQIAFSGQEPDGDVLVPDRELPTDGFTRYGRASDACFRHAFEGAGISDTEPPEPVS
jgi:hypothetical protein